MTIFYHVSKDIQHNGKFVPRIPPATLSEGEDMTTERICVSSTIAGCLTSMPNGSKKLEEFMDTKGRMFKLFIIDTEALGIPDDQIITAETLYEEDRVRDACVTHESWILSGFDVPEDSQVFIRMDDFQLVDIYHIPHEILLLAEERNEEADVVYEDEYGEEAPILMFLQNVEYLESNVQLNQEITMNVRDELHKLLIGKYITEHYQVQWKSNPETDDLHFIMLENADLKDLFEYEEELLITHPITRREKDGYILSCID